MAQAGTEKLSITEVSRYSRQLILPKWSSTTQLRLKNTSVSLADSHQTLALYLAGLGIGCITVRVSSESLSSKLSRNLIKQNPHVRILCSGSSEQAVELSDYLVLDEGEQDSEKGRCLLSLPSSQSEGVLVFKEMNVTQIRCDISSLGLQALLSREASQLIAANLIIQHRLNLP